MIKKFSLTLSLITSSMFANGLEYELPTLGQISDQWCVYQNFQTSVSGCRDQLEYFLSDIQILKSPKEKWACEQDGAEVGYYNPSNGVAIRYYQCTFIPNGNIGRHSAYVKASKQTFTTKQCLNPEFPYGADINQDMSIDICIADNQCEVTGTVNPINIETVVCD